MEKKSRSLNKKYQYSKNFCAAMWGHVYFSNDGEVNYCCLADKSKSSIGNVNQNSLEEIYNNKKFKEVRKNMLEDKSLPSACDICIDREKSNLGSLRKRFNDNFFDLISKNIDLDTGEIFDFLPKSIDVRLSNYCNLSCAMCSPLFSSRWKDYEKVTSKKEYKGLISIPFDNLFFKNLEKYITDIKFIHFAGGEPILMPEHWYILDRLSNKNIKLMYTTNATTTVFKNRSVFEEWKKFKEVLITLSIDSVEEYYEYIRYGTKWEIVKENIFKYKNSGLNYKIHPTISILNILSFPKLHEWLIENKIVIDDENTWEFLDINPLYNPSYYSIQNLPFELKQVTEEILLSHAEQYRNKSGFENLVNFMYQDQIDNYDLFLNITNNYDKLRNLSFFELYPEFKK